MKRKTQRKPGFGLIVCLILLWAAIDAPAALAHKVTVFAWLEGDTVHTESKFMGGRGSSAKNATIEVRDMQDRILLTGKTDPEGRFSFKIPEPVALKIVLLAGMGHQNQWIIEEAQVREALAGATETPAGPPPVDETEPADAPAERPRAPAPPPAIGCDQIERIVNQALDRKLAPLHSAMAEMKDPGPKIADVLGGIGYILGLVGLGAYLNARRRQRSGLRRDDS